MKIYVDMSFDKISGQQVSQKALLNECNKRKLSSDENSADILVYVQVPWDTTLVDKWKKYHEQGKKIVFIHHCSAYNAFNFWSIYNIPGLLEEVDLHIVAYEKSEIYNYLVKARGIDKSKIKCIELASIDYKYIHNKYFKNFKEKENNSICFVGRYKKGLKEFIKFTKPLINYKKYIFCPDIHKYKDEIPDDFHIFTSLSGDSLYEKLSDIQYCFNESTFYMPENHFEIVMMEAIACGTINIITPTFYSVIPENISRKKYLKKIGFVETYNFENHDKYIQDTAYRYLRIHYLDTQETMDKLITYCLLLR